MRNRLLMVMAACVLVATGVGRADPASFMRNWSFSDTDGTINAALVYDGQVYVTGTFTTIGGISASRVARFDGQQYYPLGSGLGSTNTSTLAGKAIAAYAGKVIVAGNFTTAGGVTAGSIAAWDSESQTWTTLSTGLGQVGGTPADVKCLTVSSVGAGAPALYAGGFFNLAGGQSVLNIAAWDGTMWSGAGGGVNGTVNALAEYNAALYAGGSGSSSNRFRFWTGTGAWNQVPGGTISGNSSRINALLPFGGDLYLGGSFTNGGGVTTSPNVVKYNGVSGTFAGLGAGLPDATTGVSVFTVSDDRHKVLAGGGFAGRAALFDDTSGTWETVANGLDNPVTALATFSSGSEHDIFAGSGGALVVYTPGMKWTNPGDGLNGQFSVVNAICPGPRETLNPFQVIDALYITGVFNTYFTAFNSDSINKVTNAARRARATNDFKQVALAGHGYASEALGLGLTGTGWGCLTYDYGTAARIGFFGQQTAAGGIAANGVSIYDPFSHTWSNPAMPAHSGIFTGGFFDTLATQGGNRYVYGSFSNTGTPGLDFFGRLDGVGAFTPVSCGPSATVNGLTVRDDQARILVSRFGAYLTSGCLSQPTGYIDTFDPQTEESTPFPGPYLDGPVSAMCNPLIPHPRPLASAKDDANASAITFPAFYAGGAFTSAGGIALNHVAYWNGTAWEALGSGVNGNVSAMALWDDGEGVNLYVAGSFTTAGGLPAAGLARWDGTSWSAVTGGGTANGVNGAVNSMAVVDYDDEYGPSLMLGGAFTRAGGYSSGRLAQLVANGAPIIANQPPAQTNAPVGTGVALALRAYRSPPLSYQWYKGAGALSDNGHFSGTHTPTLSIAAATADDAGTYSCLVTNTYGSTESLGASVNTSTPCRLDYNLDTVVNPDDIGDYITDYFTDPPPPGPGGYAIACPGNDAPYDAGYKTAYTSDGAGQCNLPYSDNLGDWITDYFGAGC